MNEKPPADNPNVNPMENPNARHNLGVEKSLSDRILAYAFGASVLINIGWMVAVSHSDIFGKGGVIPATKETMIKVFHRPPPPKPKIKPPPPPPPPKQLPHVKPPPLLRVQHSPPPPTPHVQQVQVVRSLNSDSRIVMPSAPPTVGPALPAVSGPVTTPPAPPAPPVVLPLPPAPPVVLPPPPAPPPPPPPPPPPRLPPPPPPKPKNWVPIETQEASYPDSLGSDVSADGIETVPNDKVVISFTIDETGHFRNVRVKESSGSPELDERYVEAIKRGHGASAIQDHIPRDQPESISFSLSK